MPQTARALFDILHHAARSTPAPDAARRQASLATLGQMILDHADEFAAAIDTDFRGRSRDETQLLEIVPAVRGIRHARRSVARWMRDERRPVELNFQPARAWVRYEPLGVVGIISPWNYPLLLALSPLTDALAAGNRALLKPSELTPTFSDLLARVVVERFPPDEVAVVTGGVDVAEAVAALPFDHLVFTGSTHVGRQVMRAAAENLTPVTLELGGKSPAIVAPDYPLAKAARSVAFGKFINAGQTCIAPDYVLVPHDRVRAFADDVMAVVERGYPTIAGNADYSAIVTDRHRARLVAAVEEARGAGATILDHQAPGGDPRRLAPVLVIDPPRDCTLMREEIFGPVLPILGYRTLADAMAVVNERDRPLALYCFSTDRATEGAVLDGCTSGGVTINGTLLHIAQDSLPFGGIGPSGMGAYHGREGFRRLSHHRAVYRVGAFNVFERLGPPWSDTSRRIAHWLAKA